MSALLGSGGPLISYAYASRGAGRISLPVSSSNVIYANFRHVYGSAAPEGATPFSLDRLKILDVLIEQLASIKSEPLAAAEAPSDLSSGRVDALIQQYSAEIHARAAAPTMPYAAPMAVQPGMLFSFAA